MIQNKAEPSYFYSTILAKLCRITVRERGQSAASRFVVACQEATGEWNQIEPHDPLAVECLHLGKVIGEKNAERGELLAEVGRLKARLAQAVVPADLFNEVRERRDAAEVEVLRLRATFAEGSRHKTQDFGELHRLAQALADATGERVPFTAGLLSLAALPPTGGPVDDRPHGLAAYQDSAFWKGYRRGAQFERKEWQRRHADLMAKERERAEAAEARAKLAEAKAAVYLRDGADEADLAALRLKEIGRLRAEREEIRARGWTDEMLASRCCEADYVTVAADFFGVPGQHKRQSYGYGAAPVHRVESARPTTAENGAAIASGWGRAAAAARAASDALGKSEVLCKGGDVSIYGYDWKCGRCGASGLLIVGADDRCRVPPHTPGVDDLQKTRGSQ